MIILPDTKILSPLFCYSKKSVFEEIADCGAFITGRSAQDIIRSLNKREEWGTTVFFQGVAIPHAVIEGIEKNFAVLSILDKPVPFNSVDADEQLVDIAFTLFISEKSDYDETEKLLKDLTTILSDQDLLNALRMVRNEKHKIEVILNQIDLMLDKIEHGMLGDPIETAENQVQ